MKRIYLFGFSALLLILIGLFSFVFANKQPASSSTVKSWQPELIPEVFLEDLSNTGCFKKIFLEANKVAGYESNHCRCDQNYRYSSSNDDIVLTVDGHVLSSEIRYGQIYLKVYGRAGWAAYGVDDRNNGMSFWRPKGMQTENFNLLLNEELVFWRSAVKRCKPLFDIEDLFWSLNMTELDHIDQERIVSLFEEAMLLEIASPEMIDLNLSWDSVTLKIDGENSILYFWAFPERDVYDYGIRIEHENSQCWISFRDGNAEHDYSDLELFLDHAEKILQTKAVERGALQCFFVLKKTAPHRGYDVGRSR